MPQNLKQISVLVVEDSPTDALLLKTQLKSVEQLSFDIDTAHTLAEGIAKVTGDVHDVIILDLGLPDSFGLPTLNSMMTNAPVTPIIVLTGNDDREALAQALNNGAANYLIKDTVDGNRIAIAILSAIREKKDGTGDDA